MNPLSFVLGRANARGYLAWLMSHRALILVATVVLGLAAGWRTVATYASLRSELEELLPRSAPSVAALGELRQRLPGQRFLGIVVDTGPKRNVAAANRFIDDLAGVISKYPPSTVLAVRKDLSIEKAFLERYALQMMAPEDVRRLREAVEARRDYEVSKGLDLTLDDDEESVPPPLPIEELKKKYLQSEGAAKASSDGRLVSKDGRTAVLVVQVNSHTTGINDDLALLARVNGDIARLGFPAAYDSKLSLGFAADIPARVEEMNGLYFDLGVSGAIATLLVLLIVMWFFHSVRAVPILGVPLLLGTLFTFGIVALPPLAIRSLNTNTAFLGSVIVGNGVNCGIILLGRFSELRGKGLSPVDALERALGSTVRPTLAASLAAATAYGSLVLTDFRGFTQFGWIGGIGMLTCWVTTYVVGPPLILLYGESLGSRTDQRTLSHWLASFFRAALRRPSAVVWLGVAITAVSSVGLFLREAPWVEHDYSKLRRRDSFVSGERYWGKRMDETLGRYLTPTIVMASSPEAASSIAERVRALCASGAAGDLIASVRTADQLLPKTRHAATAEAKKLSLLLTPKLRSALDPKERELVDKAISEASLVPVQAGDVPAALISGLREHDGSVGRTLLVYPKATGGTWDGPRIAAYTEDLRAAARAVDPNAVVAGGIPLSSDITAAMAKDGPRAAAFALAAALVVCLVAFGSWSLSMMAIASVFVGVIWMLGGLSWPSATLNFANFVTLPITFGVSADYAINVLRRQYAGDEATDTSDLAQTCGAVALCSATTIFGFGSLLAAKSVALFSFGVFAVVGETTTLVTATLLLPSVLSLLRSRSHRLGPQGPKELDLREQRPREFVCKEPDPMELVPEELEVRS